MDSRLIAGAYSQHFRALEKEEALNDSDRIDSIARAKRLSQETNKRRKVQAQKRKLEAKREERRRQDILTRRREEQKQATEKYQRSHLPPSARQASGRFSPRRPDGRALEDALRLIRGSSHYDRPRSNRERILTPRSENDDPLERSYFDKPRSHSARPSSGRSTYQLDPSSRAELMDFSLQNLTSSKTLFEQQLEQQQNLLLQQQQQSLKEFDNAVRQEIDRPLATDEVTGDYYDDGNIRDNEGMTGNDSCSSIDSLEACAENEQNQGQVNGASRQRPTSAHHGIKTGQKSSSEQESQQIQVGQKQQEVEKQQHLHSDVSNNAANRLNQDMTASALYQKEAAIVGMPRTETGQIQTMNNHNNAILQHNHPYVGVTREDILHNQDKKTNGQQMYQLPNKQFSTDSLESFSSTSSISVVKLPAASGGTGHGTEMSAYSQTVGSGGKGSGENFSSGVDSQAHDPFHQPFGSDRSAGTTGGIAGSPSQGQMAWISPSPQSDSSTPKQTPTPTNKKEPVMEDFHPRYASAIGLSIWPGQGQANQVPTSVMSTLLANNNHPYSSRGTFTSVTTTTSFPASMPARSIPSTSTYSTAGNKTDTVLNSGVVGSSLSAAHFTNFHSNSNVPNDFSSLSKQDLTYPLFNDYQHHGTVSPNMNQNHNVHFSSASLVNHQQMGFPSSQAIDTTASSKQTSIHTGKTQQGVSSGSHISTFSQHPEANSPMSQNQYQHQSSIASTGPVPVPAVRTVFPTGRPPAPVSNTNARTYYSAISSVGQTKVNGVNNEQISVVEAVKDQSSAEARDDLEDEELPEGENEDMPPLKGILKATPSKAATQIQGKASQAKNRPRDSLELARVQNDKKGKKKSVRFADNHIEEDDNENDETDNFESRAMMVTNSGMAFQRNTTNRPASAKVVTMSAKSDPSIRGQRASSAGTVRQNPSVSEHMQIRNVQQLQSSSTLNGTDNNMGYNQRSNLPPSFVNPLNTTPIHRPKAAAHIIMSTDLNTLSKGVTNGYDIHGHMNHAGSAAATAHKSQLDSKVKPVNKNFMSKVPVKVPSPSDHNAVVYHVAKVESENNLSSAANANGNNVYTENNQQTMNEAQEGTGKRTNYSPTKKIPISNSTVTRTNIVPASTKINYPQSNPGAPSYSVGTAGTSMAQVYDENGLRIDRTPTDEEITWLWDKVRNCLDKDEGGNKTQPAGGGNGDQGTRQPTTMSTKLIDGASLGFGTNSAAGINGLRTGAGYVYQRAASATTTQNKVKPAVQQQGSYLRRYGLLKHRRVNSASAAGNGGPVTSQRAHSAFARQPTIQPTTTIATTTGFQPQEAATLAFGYKPQDEVSESTAAFVMAERLAKQSLSDSHIQAAMEDAHTKQEAHNRARLAVTRGPPSALSIEEQKLMESLDKLNERLKVKDNKYNGTIHYHQPFQPHLPGFRGHTPVIDSRRQNLISPRSQVRAQSARIRQQTRQYR